jgi:hypothetical protein
MNQRISSSATADFFNKIGAADNRFPNLFRQRDRRTDVVRP